jgi:hypothetical protein
VAPKATATKVLPLAATSNHVLVFAIVTADQVSPLSTDRAAWFEPSATATKVVPLAAIELYAGVVPGKVTADHSTPIGGSVAFFFLPPIGIKLGFGLKMPISGFNPTLGIFKLCVISNSSLQR